MKLIHRNNTFVLLGQGDGVEKVGKEAGLLYSTTGSLQERQHVFFTPEPHAVLHLWDVADEDARSRLAPLRAEWERSNLNVAPPGFDVPVPEFCQMMPFQVAGVHYAKDRDNCLIGDAPGLGKTIQAIALANLRGCKRVLVVCPANVRLQWARQIKIWSTLPKVVVYPVLKSSDGVHPTANYVITSFEVARGNLWQALRSYPWDLLVIDECFPFDTPVDTSGGPICIGRIVEERLPVKVWSRNRIGELELMSITRYIRTPAPLSMIRIRHENGVLECTENHKVYVDGKSSPIPAKDIRPGQILRVVQSGFFGRAKDAEILRENLLGEVALQHTRFAADSGHARNEAAVSPSTGCVNTNESYELRSGISRQTGRYVEVAERPIVVGETRGERLLDGTAETLGQRDRLADGIRHIDGGSERSLQELAVLLQSGLGVPENETCGGSRREQPQHEALALSGRQENRGVECSRVDSVEVYEPAGRHGPWVYNLEVEKNHNYFAAGVLVGNCHYLKTPDANRTRALFGASARAASPYAGTRGIAERAEQIVALTGTPLPNRPRECYTMANALDASCIDWMNFDQFKDRFNPGGRDPVSGATWEYAGRLPELNARLRCNIMVRRLKEDVLKDLPPKRYELVPVETTLKIQMALQAERMLHFDEQEMLARSGGKIDGAISTVRREMGEALAPAAVDHCRMLLDGGVEKLVVFAHHHSVLDFLNKGLAPFGVLRVDGGTSVTGKGRAVEQFVHNPRMRVFLGQSQAVGTGTDGLQDIATHAFFAEADWVFGNIEQCVDRLHRMGQRGSVLAQILTAPGSIAERIIGRAIAKGRTTAKVLDGQPINVNEF